MRHFRICLLPIAALLALGACSANQSAAVTGAAGAAGAASSGLPSGAVSTLQIFCKIDGVAQPIAAAVVAALVPAGAAAVAFDAGFMHPSIVAYCASLNGSAVSATVVPASTSSAPTGMAAPAGAPAGAVSPPAPAGAVPGTTLTVPVAPVAPAAPKFPA